MNINDFEQFASMWELANEGVHNKVTPSCIEWSYEILKDHSIDDIMDALIANAKDPKNGRFAPTPAAIIEQIRIAHEKAKQPVGLQALPENWDEWDA